MSNYEERFHINLQELDENKKTMAIERRKQAEERMDAMKTIEVLKALRQLEKKLEKDIFIVTISYVAIVVIAVVALFLSVAR